MRYAQLEAALASRGGDVHKAARVVRGDDRASRLGERVELPLGEAIGHARPLEAEAASETAAVRDVGQVDDFIARQLEEPARFAFQTELAQRLAGVVVGDLKAEALAIDQIAIGVEQLPGKAGRVTHWVGVSFVVRGTRGLR